MRINDLKSVSGLLPESHRNPLAAPITSLTAVFISIYNACVTRGSAAQGPPLNGTRGFSALLAFFALNLFACGFAALYAYNLS